MTTVSLAADGTITVVDSVRYSTFTSGSAGGFAFVNGDVWALVYMKGDGAGDLGNIVGTFTCDSAGNLGANFIDTFTITGVPTNALYAPDIIKVANATNIFAVASTDDLNDGWVTTLTINNDGSIDDAALDSWEFDTSFGRYVSIWHRSGTVYMITYGGAVPNGYIITFNIQDDGTLPSVPGEGGRIDTKAIWNQLNLRAAVFPISGDVYAFVWHGNDNDSFVNTREITAAGTINAQIDVWEYEPTNGPHAHALVIDDNEAVDGKVICAFHSALAGVNGIHTFEISNAGSITKSFIDEKALHATNVLYFPVIVDAVDVAPGLYLLFMRDVTASVGTVQSREIERAPQVPTVTTEAASGVGVASATLNGTLDHQGAAPSDCGFEWGLDTGYGTTTATQTKTTGESFSQALGGLQPGTIYHFRAFATNPVGTSYGADRTFTTVPVTTRAYALARQEL